MSVGLISFDDISMKMGFSSVAARHCFFPLFWKVHVVLSLSASKERSLCAMVSARRQWPSLQVCSAWPWSMSLQPINYLARVWYEGASCRT